jgi:hypothetical protein
LDWLASNAIGGVKVDVADEDYDRALSAIAATTTSEEKALAASAQMRVSELERGFRQGIVRFIVGAIPLGFIAYFVTPAPEFKQSLMIYERQPPDLRPLAAVAGAIAGGLFVSTFLNRKKPNQPPEPMPLKRHGSPQTTTGSSAPDRV